MTERIPGALHETLAVFDGATPLTTAEVAADLDVSRRAAYDRLGRLADRGRLATKKVGASGRIWWRPDQENATTPSDGSAGRAQLDMASLLDDLPGLVYRCGVEPDWDMSFVSAGCREVTGYDAEALEAGEVSYGADVVHPSDYDHVRDAVASGLETDGEFTIQYRIRTADGETRWVWERGRGVGDGDEEFETLQGVITDITEQKETEQQLREERDLTDELFAAAPSSIVVLDTDGRIARANDRAIERLDLERADGDGYVAGDTDVYDESGDPVPPGDRPYLESLQTGEPVEDWYCQIELPSSNRRWAAINAEPIRDPDGAVERVVITSTDVTELKRKAERLGRERDELAAELDEVFSRIDDAFYALDDEFRFTYVNEQAEALLRQSEADLLGERVWDRFPEATETPAWDAFHEALETQEPIEYEVYFEPLSFWVQANVYPSESGLSVYFRDVTERKERELELERYERILQDLPVGVYRVTPEPDGEIVETNLALADIFDAESVDAIEGTSVREFYIDPERRRELSERIQEQGVVHGVELRQETLSGERIWVSVTARAVEENGDVYFDGVLRDVTERKLRERQLERQRERLAALNHLNAVVRDINEALVEESTREEIERAVCERLADTDSYDVAWIGTADPRTQSVEPRVEAGPTNSLDTLDLTPDGEIAETRSLATEAIHTKEIQVVADVRADGAEMSPTVPDQVGARAAAAIPVVYEDTVYGVLSIYTDRQGAFVGEERDVVAQLGTLIGHAIAAVERKQALMSESAVELEFFVSNVLAKFGVESAPDGRITIEETVPIGDETYLVYGWATDDAIDAVRTVTESAVHWDRVTVLGNETDRTRFELRLTEPPVVSAVAAHGGEIDRAVIEDGDFSLTIHLPQSVTARRIIDAVQEAYPDAEMVARRQVTRADGRTELTRTLTEELTDRQRAALEAAYHAGFFEWPRTTDGESVAESLDVSSPTFHQHLRAAERKLVDAVLS